MTVDVGAVLTGFVHAQDGQPVEGVTVRALYDGDDARKPLEELAAHPSCSRTTTDAAGAFTLRGMLPGHKYQLVAAGRGWVPPGAARSVGIAGQTEPVILHVAPLYAVAIRVLDRGGGEIIPQVDADRFSMLSSLRGLAPFGDDRVLSGAGVFVPNDFQPPRARHRHLFLFTAGSVEERLGPLTFQATAPGYEDVSSSVWALRMTERELVVQEILLNPLTSMTFGDIRVRLPPMPAGEQVPEQSLGILRLRPDGWTLGNLRYLETWIRLPAADLVVRGVPSGPYAVELLNTVLLPGACGSIGTVNVPVGGEAVLSVRDVAAGRLVVVPFVEATAGDAGTPYHGRISVSIHYGKDYGASLGIALNHPPYCVVAIAPGAYRVRCRCAGYLDTMEDVVITAKETTEVRLNLHAKREGE